MNEGKKPPKFMANKGNKSAQPPLTYHPLFLLHVHTKIAESFQFSHLPPHHHYMEIKQQKELSKGEIGIEKSIFCPLSSSFLRNHIKSQ